MFYRGDLRTFFEAKTMFLLEHPLIITDGSQGLTGNSSSSTLEFTSESNENWIHFQ